MVHIFLSSNYQCACQLKISMENPKLCPFTFFFVSLCLFTFVLFDCHFKGFEDEDGEAKFEESSINPASIQSPHSQSLSTDPNPNPNPNPFPPFDLPKSTPPSTTTFDFWDDDEFEGIPTEQYHTDRHIPTTDPKSTDTRYETQKINNWVQYHVLINNWVKKR